MVEEYAEKWWLVALRGIIGVLLGIVLISWPVKSLAVFVWIVGLFALVEGVILVLMSLFNAKKWENWGYVFMQGVISLILGLILFAWPEITIAALFFLIALWIIVAGILLIVQGIKVRKEIGGGEWMLIAGGIISILFAFFLFSNPQVSLALAGVIIGLVILVSGIFTTAFGLQIRRFEKKVKKLER